MQTLIDVFEQRGWLHISVFTVNILLYLLASPLIKLINGGIENKKQVSILRALNVSFLVLHAVDITLLMLNQQYRHFFSNMAWTLLIIYCVFILYNFSGFLIRKKFGGSRDLDKTVTYYDTYNSRLINMLFTIIMTMIGIMLIIKLWDFNSLLETTGVFGVIIAFLALTNSIWAPDLYYGLVILNSKMLEEGDVVTFDDRHDNYFIINRVNFVYTILLDISNNDRVMIRNARMIDMSINNKSKKASIEGLRQSLTYKISYPRFVQDHDFGYETFSKSVDNMFKAAQDIAFEDEHILVNENVPFNWMINEVGDHAIEYILMFHIASMPSTRSTRTIRNYLLVTPRLINEAVYRSSLKFDIDLSTPITVHQVQ